MIYSPAPVSSLSFKTIAQMPVVIKVSCSQGMLDKWMDGQTNDPQAISLSNFFGVGGIKISCPKISFTKVSDEIAYANSVDPDEGAV